jgi:hypothetical protein
MAKQFNGIDVDSAQYAGVSDEYYKQISTLFGELSKEELQVAINVASSTDNLEDFVEEFELKLH